MKIQLIRDGHIGPYIFGRLTIEDQVYHTAEMVDGALPVGAHEVTLNEHGRPVIGKDYLICDHKMGRYSPAGLTMGLHMSNDGWDFTDKVTISRHVQSEMVKALNKDQKVQVIVSYRVYEDASLGARPEGNAPKKATPKKVKADAVDAD